jgi:hypothetical protein
MPLLQLQNEYFELNEQEREYVIAQELMYMAYRNTFIGTIAATFADARAYLANMARWAAIFGGNREENNRRNIFSMIVIAIVAPYSWNTCYVMDINRQSFFWKIR